MAGFIEVMVKLAPFFGEITAEERNLFSAAYKNLVGPLRAACRIVYSIEEKEVNRGSHGHAALIKDYRLSIQSELSGVCGGILALLDSHLIPFAISIESKVFYLKMKGDYYRYLAKIEAAGEGKKAADSTQAAYTEAQDIALVHLAPTHPLRLGLALNFAVYHYEILNSSEKACRMAKQAFEEAIAELDSLGEESYKDSLLILQLLHDNLTLWTSEAQDRLNEP